MEYWVFTAAEEVAVPVVFVLLFLTMKLDASDLFTAINPDVAGALVLTLTDEFLHLA